MTTCAHPKHAAGCDSCRRYARAYDRRRRTAIRSGTWHPPVPVAEVRTHIDLLRASGMTLTRIAAAAGLSRHTVYSLTNGPRQVVHGATAAALAAVTPQPSLPANMTSAVGSIRRIRALVADGYSLSDIARRLGVAMQRVWQWAHADPSGVTHQTAARIAALYDQLECASGPSTRARNMGRAYGWAPPEAWPGSAIDDPGASPADPELVVDEVLVRRVLAEEAPAASLNEAERAEALRLMVRRGWSAGRVSRVLGMAHSTAKARMAELRAA